MRVAVYARVSTQQQVSTQTIEQQLDRLQAQCQTQGYVWREEDVFRDDGHSGSSLQRPGLERLRERVASASYARVLITAPDRLARHYVHQWLLIEEFEQAGCQVEFLDRPMSHDPHDQLLLQIRGAVAEYERTLITERLRRGRHQKYRSGTLLPWTTPPFGYRSTPDRPRDPAGVWVEPAEAAVVTELFAAYLEEGASVASVAKQLSRLGIPSPTGLRYWSRATVARILGNPVYAGQVYAGKGRARPIGPRQSALRPPGKRLRGLSPTPPEEWIFVGQVPALISAEQFAAVQAKLALNQHWASRNNRVHQYLLRRLVSCGWCQMACVGQTRQTYTYYVCRGKAHPVISNRSEKCHARGIPMRQLDEVVWQDVCEVLTHPQMLAHALERVQAGDWLPHELQARRANVRKATSHLTQQIERLTEAYLGQVLGLEEYRRRRRELEERVAGLAEQQRELEASLAHRRDLASSIEHITQFCQRVQAGLAQATFEQKRQLLHLLIDRIVVKDEEVEIRYVIPLSARSEHTRFYQLRLTYCRAPAWNVGA
jgi:site-specific DNA recombinase